MAIYEPTNITPSIFTQTQAVDVANDTVSIGWQVNGTSPMTAYQFDIYPNTALATTPLFSSGKIANGIPTGGFYGVDGRGNINMFSFTLSQTWATWTSNALSNGNDYAYTITQFYPSNNVVYKVNNASLTANTTYYFAVTTTSGATKYATYTPTTSGSYTLYYDVTNSIAYMLTSSGGVKQITMALVNSATGTSVTASVITSADSFYHLAFIQQNGANVLTARATPTLTLTINGENEPTLVSKGIINVVGNYTQTENDMLKSVKWTLTTLANKVIDETPIINTQLLQYEYDGLFDGIGYILSCEIETQNNKVLKKSVQFVVGYTEGAYTGYFRASCRCKDYATMLEWEGVTTINPTINGQEPTYEDGYNGRKYAVIPNGTTIAYNEVDGEAMSFTAPYTIVVKNKLPLNGTSGTIFTGNNNQRVGYSIVGSNLILTYGTSYMLTIPTSITADTLETIVTPTELKALLFSNGELVSTYSTAITLATQTITLLTLGGNQNVYCFTVYDDYDNLLMTYLSNADFEPDWNNEEYTLLLSATMNGNVEGGTASTSGGGFHIYRNLVGSTERTLVGIAGSNITRLKDFGIKSGEKYEYYLAVYDNTDTFMREVKATQKGNDDIDAVISPVFDNYTLLSTIYNEADGCYHVAREFKFALNLSDTGRSNNNAPSSYENFTAYRTYMNSCQKHESGMLQGLIGSVDENTNEYTESARLRKELSELSQTSNTLFLRTMKGELFMVKVSAPVQLPFTLATKQMQTTFSITWEECGSTDGVAIVQTPLDSGWINGNPILDVKIDVNVDTGVMVFTYPTDYYGTTFAVDGEYLVATTPDDIEQATFSYNDDEALLLTDGTLSVIVEEE